MINTIKNILGLGPKTDLAELVNNGAQIIDVRTKAEFQLSLLAHKRLRGTQ